MKTIVTVCRSITENVEDYEKSNNLSHETESTLYELKSRFSNALSDLLTSAKYHANGMGITPVSLLDNSAGHLTSVIVELAKLLGMSPSNRSNNDYSLKSSYSSSSKSDYFSKSDYSPKSDYSSTKNDYASKSDTLSPSELTVSLILFSSSISYLYMYLELLKIRDRQHHPNHPKSISSSSLTPAKR
jgi:hypothetical protein